MNCYILYTCTWLFISMTEITCTPLLMNQIKRQVYNEKIQINQETVNYYLYLPIYHIIIIYNIIIHNIYTLTNIILFK